MLRAHASIKADLKYKSSGTSHLFQMFAILVQALEAHGDQAEDPDRKASYDESDRKAGYDEFWQAYAAVYRKNHDPPPPPRYVG